MLSSILLLSGCGGGGSSDPSPSGPGPLDRIAAAQAGLKSTVDLSSNRVTLQWYSYFQQASRFQIETQRPDGTWEIVDGVGSGTGPSQPVQWSGALSGPTVFRAEAVFPDYTVPLQLVAFSSGATDLAVALPNTIPTLQIDQPLTATANVTLANAGTVQYTNYSVDGLSFAGNLGTSSVMLDPTGYLAGTHTLSATSALDDAHSFTVSTPLAIDSGKPAIRVQLVQSPKIADVYVLATSNTLLVSANLIEDFKLLDTLTAMNACAPPPCAPGQAFNAFWFSVNTGDLAATHSLQAQVTDAAGNVARFDQIVSVPSPPTGTLTTPVDGDSASGMLHLTGNYGSGTTGALEVLVTLSGIQVYDTTIANPGTLVPLQTDVSLAGISPGPHTVGMYVRVGNAHYTQVASVVINVEK
jgi:hypothetical protein